MNMNFILELAKKLNTTEFRDILKYLYVDENLSLRSMANILGISHSQIFNLIKQNGISKEKKKC